MSRLTRNIRNKQDYCEFELKDCRYQDIYEFEKYSELEENVDCVLTLAIDKLGQLEDLMEKHNIKSIDDLDKKLKALETIKEVTNIELLGEVFTGLYCIVFKQDAEDGGDYIDVYVPKEKYDLLKGIN